MGGFFSRFWKRLFSTEHQVKLLIVGLDAAGKTTLLYHLKQTAPHVRKYHKTTGKTGLIPKSMPLSSSEVTHHGEGVVVAAVGGANDNMLQQEPSPDTNQIISGSNSYKPTPTIGFNLDQFKFKNVNIKMWDLAGQQRLRQLWGHYFMAVQGIIFVVDSANQQRFGQVREQLHKILSDNDILKVPVLIMANKQDLPNAYNVQKLRGELALEGSGQKGIRGAEGPMQRVKLVDTCALDGTGIIEGLQWVVDRIKMKGKKK